MTTENQTYATSIASNVYKRHLGERLISTEAHKEGDYEIRTERTRVCIAFTGRQLRALVNEYNAAHIAACWNACLGINPEAVPDVLAACEDLLDAIDAEHPDGAKGSKTDLAYERARAAIAKAHFVERA